jgi:hypothetical protein
MDEPDISSKVRQRKSDDGKLRSFRYVSFEQ